MQGGQSSGGSDLEDNTVARKAADLRRAVEDAVGSQRQRASWDLALEAAGIRAKAVNRGQGSIGSQFEEATEIRCASTAGGSIEISISAQNWASWKPAVGTIPQGGAEGVKLGKR